MTIEEKLEKFRERVGVVDDRDTKINIAVRELTELGKKVFIPQFADMTQHEYTKFTERAYNELSSSAANANPEFTPEERKFLIKVYKKLSDATHGPWDIDADLVSDWVQILEDNGGIKFDFFHDCGSRVRIVGEAGEYVDGFRSRLKFFEDGLLRDYCHKSLSKMPDHVYDVMDISCYHAGNFVTPTSDQLGDCKVAEHLGFGKELVHYLTYHPKLERLDEMLEEGRFELPDNFEQRYTPAD